MLGKKNCNAAMESAVDSEQHSIVVILRKVRRCFIVLLMMSPC